MSRLAKAKIPDDWDGENWRLAVLCVPDSLQWRALVRGAIYQLTRGRNYDENTGVIKDAQAVGWEILESLDMTCGEQLERIANALEKHNAIIAGEEVTIEEVPYDYTETGLIPSLNAALFVDRLLYPDLSISEVLFKGLIARTVDLPLPLEGVGISDIADLILTMLTQLDGRFRQTDLQFPPSFEKNITETLETLLRTTGLFDPELKPNVTDTLLHTLSVGNDSFLWKTFVSLANQILAQLGSDIRIPVDDEDPKTLAEILLVISRLLENGNIMTGQLDLSTIINLNNCQACGCANGNCICNDGPTITVEDDTAQITEGGDNLLECGCSEE